jgi:hypothetical protein
MHTYIHTHTHTYIILVGKREGKRRDHSEDLGVNGRVILDGILGYKMERCGLDSSGSR